MISFKTCLLLFALLSYSVFFVSCTTTITKVKDPAFSLEIKTIQADLKKIVTCQHINLNGKEVTSEGKTTSELEISIINGKNIPTDNTQLRTLGKTIASDIKKSLKDPNEYSKYKVLFVTVVENAGLTKKAWKSDEFASAEL